MKYILTFLFLSSTLSLNSQPAEPSPFPVFFSGTEKDLIPEGIAFDELKNEFYVGSTYKRKIIKIDSDGYAEDFIEEADHGIKGVLGLEIDANRRVLWALSADIGNYMPIKNSDTTELGHSFIHQFDMDSGDLIKKFSLSSPGKNFFLNDLTLDPSGNIFITETMGQSIYMIRPGSDSIELFLQLPDKHYPNGIDISGDGKSLFVALYAEPKHKYAKIIIEGKKLEFIKLPENVDTGADGLYYYKNSLVGIIPMNENAVVQYILNENGNEITDHKILLADNDQLAQPTTGVIVENKFYFIATSNLQVFAKEYRENNGTIGTDKLQPLKIGVLNLE